MIEREINSGIVSLFPLGFRLPNNLRAGNWFLDYMSHRLKQSPGTSDLGHWLDEVPFSVLKRVPRYLIPRYFDVVVTKLYCKMLERTWYLFIFCSHRLS